MFNSIDYIIDTLGEKEFNHSLSVLKKGGILRVATDHKVYKSWVLHQLHNHENFRWTATCGNDWKHQPADWVETKYQRKAIREGRRPVFLDYERI